MYLYLGGGSQWTTQTQTYQNLPTYFTLISINVNKYHDFPETIVDPSYKAFINCNCPKSIFKIR